MTQRTIKVLTISLLIALSLVRYAHAAVKIHPLHLESDSWIDYTYAAVRDRQGFLWIATEEDLKRYDGYNLRSFTNDVGNAAPMAPGSIRSLLLQSNGGLWAAGANLSQYHVETESFTSFPITKQRTIRTLYEDHQGFFWLGGEGFGLLRFDPHLRVVTHTFSEEPFKDNIWRIIAHNTTQFWVASDKGLYLVDSQTFASDPYPVPMEFETGVEAIRAIADDQNGKVWVGTFEGLFVVDAETKEVQRYVAQPGDPRSLSTNMITSIMSDADGRVWIGTDKSGVHQYQPETDDFTHFRASAHDPYTFPLGSVSSISQDSEGTLWFSLGHYGVYRLSPHVEKFTAFKHSFDSANSLAFNNVLDIYEDHSGIIWIGTDGGGLSRFDPGANKFTNYKHDPNNPDSLSSDTVIAVAGDSKGFIWLGTWGGGLNRLDPANGKFTRFSRKANAPRTKALADNDIFRIEVDAEDRLFLSVWGQGLQIYNTNDDVFTLYSPNDTSGSGIRSNSINDILPTPDGKYWIAGYKGLELFSPDTGTFSVPKLSIIDPISDLHLDDDGLLWVATNQHLIRYNPTANIAQYFSVEQGLSDRQITSIEQDDAGYLWLGTRKGLNRFNPDTKEVLIFDEQDGLAGSQFNRFSHLKARDGHLYFGGINGLTRFNPQNLPNNEHAPQIHIIDIEINQKLQKFGSSEWLDRAINSIDTLTLPNSQRDITFYFSATNLIAPSNNRYRYRLKGLEEEWIDVDPAHRRVRYNNLDHGEYQFQLIAANNEGVWAGTAKEVTVIILPEWWQTWWAQVVYVMMLLAAMYLFSYWRLRSNRQQQKRLETLVDEQTSKLKEANRAIILLNTELEQRVIHRTQELSLEIEERRESEAKAHYIAYHDSLTRLYNRAWLLKHLDELIASSAESGTPFALFFVGGDRFRKINDTYGHLFGDKLLIAAAERLTSLLPKDIHAVRLGSDEFTVVVDHVDSQEDTRALVERITNAFQPHFLIEQVRVNFAVSVGYVISDERYTEPSQVLRSANIAMQTAKDRGRGVYQMFDEEIFQQTLSTAALEADLKQALTKQEFKVVYQPIVAIESEELRGFEVLLRWHHPERGLVPPDKFIPMAESLGLIFDIGLWVLEQACQQLQQWRTEINPNNLPTISVNLSPIQLERFDLLEQLDEIFNRTQIDYRYIRFEITESALMKHTDTVEAKLESLRDRGIELAIDDFGTGYSSLSYLDKLPVQILKIDRSFVNALTDTPGTNSSAHEIVRATISLAHNLNLKVVAEGIETREQWNALKSYRCDYGQGYLIARPLSPTDATAFLSNALAEEKLTREK